MPTVRLLQTPFAQGEVIGGRYRVERIIAEGGMGIIVAARHLELEETVAIKFLKDEFASKPEIVGRFAREAKAAAKIKCEYTATVHDVGISVDRGPYIVMEYLEGEDLEQVLQADGRVPFARATELMMQAGEAIAVAHANGIIHRDIKPANLFLVKRDHGVPIIKVLDFGVSKTALTGNVFGGTISLVKTQALVGSPIYMSPEQLRGGNVELGFTADIWSIGAVMYELITGETAFTGSSITELCASVLESEPEAMTVRAPDCPSGLVDAIMKCMRKDPAARWQSVAELVVALAPYAPKRARMSVDRVVAVSKAANLVPTEFVGPASLPPPNHAATLPPATSSAAVARDATQDATRDATVTSSPAFDPPAQSSNKGLMVALLTLCAVGILGAIVFVVQSMMKEPPPPATATTAAATSNALPAATTPAVTAAGTPAAVTATNERAPTASPVGANNGPRPGAPTWKNAPVRPNTPPSAKPAVAVTPEAPAPTPAAPRQNATGSAIDDRK